ncbi:MAG: TolB family protein [Egibacteraceae bacterium]
MNQQVYVARPDGTGLRRLTDGGSEHNRLGRWTRDGEALAVTSNRRGASRLDAFVVDVASGTQDATAVRSETCDEKAARRIVRGEQDILATGQVHEIHVLVPRECAQAVYDYLLGSYGWP